MSIHSRLPAAEVQDDRLFAGEVAGDFAESARRDPLVATLRGS
jgi:hypothetical protein